MDNRLCLVKNFYNTIDKTSVKIETKSHGFDYMEKLATIGNLKYCEWKNSTFKYKVTDLKDGVFDTLLKQHLEDKINFCAYFNHEKNNIFCFNLDSFDDDFTNIKITAVFLLRNLLRLNITPLILKSGHGYHFWVRLQNSFENARLINFMQNIMDVATFQTVCQKVSIKELQCIFYPRFNADDISIRLFGTHHTVTGEFLSIVIKIDDKDTVLSEEESWRCFEDYLKNGCVSNETFEFAEKEVEKLAKIIKNP